MKKIISFLVIIPFGCGLLIYNFNQRVKAENDLNHRLIEEERNRIIKESDRFSQKTNFILIIEIALIIAIFFIVRNVDKKFKVSLTSFYKDSIKHNARNSAKKFLLNIFKYFVFQHDRSLSAIKKSSFINLVNFLFNFVLLWFVDDFKTTSEYIKSGLKFALTDFCHGFLIEEYKDILFGLYQNYYLNDFCSFNNNLQHFYDYLKMKGFKESSLKEIKKLLSIKIVEQKRQSAYNYLFSSGLICTGTYLFASKEGSLYDYLATSVRSDYSFTEIWKALQKQYQLKKIKRKIFICPDNHIDFKNLEKNFNFVNNQTTLNILWMFFVRCYFSESSTFLTFLFDFIFDFSIKEAFSSLADNVFDDDSFINKIRNDRNIKDMFSGQSSLF